MRNRTQWLAAATLALSACASGSRTEVGATESRGSASGTIADNTPGFIKHAADLGPSDPAQVIDVTVWLKLHNESQLEQLVRQQQTRGHANFHRWITQDQFNAQFAPTANELNAVKNWLESHNLTTLDVAENRFYLRVQGTVAAVEKAFHVQIDDFSFDGQTVRANTGNPSINDSSGNHVAAITGLDDLGFEPQNVRPVGLDGEPAAAIPLSSAGPGGAFFESGCFRSVETHTFTGATATATYTGNRFGADIDGTEPGHLPPCGYSPEEVRMIYNMNDLYASGLDGSGETIVIVDAFGSPTIERDAAAFSAFYGLPPIDLTISKAQGLPHNPGSATGWDFETTLDVEWAHAMAPGAKIALVLATNRASLEEAVNYAVVHHLGNTISNSWLTVEGFGNPARLARVERILQMAAAQGIDVNFASGDWGDNLARFGLVTVGYPASSPFATGIGGTTVALDGSRRLLFETGWGNNLTFLSRGTQGNAPRNPPLRVGFQFGAGGGASLTFAKPAFQASLPGTTRQVPDIGMLGDPLTGAEVIQTDVATGELFVTPIGGTSLATPLFSGIMAIAAQKAGHPLGQAAPLLYGLHTGVRDILPVSSESNVAGSITTAAGTTAYSDVDLVVPETATPFYSAFYQLPTGTFTVLSFNTDTSLTTGPGWDDVTGLGAPDGVNFVNAMVQ